MCTKYLSDELIGFCSEESDRDNCGNACNHCVYSKDFFDNVSLDEFDSYQEYEEYIEAETKERLKFEKENLKELKEQCLRY